MRYLPDHNITFIHNPKTAGTSISQWLDDNFKTIEGRKHGGWKEAQEFFPDTIFTFGVVRNPWERLASWFTFAGQGEFEDWLVKRILYGHNDIPSIGLTFKPTVGWARQWYNLGKPQADWLGDNINLTLRYENLQEDFNIICDKIGIPCQKLPHKNKSKHKHYTEYYDGETKSIVAEKFAKDIEYFGYEFGQ